MPEPEEEELGLCGFSVSVQQRQTHGKLRPYAVGVNVYTVAVQTNQDYLILRELTRSKALMFKVINLFDICLGFKINCCI